MRRQRSPSGTPSPKKKSIKAKPTYYYSNCANAADIATLVEWDESYGPDYLINIPTPDGRTARLECFSYETIKQMLHDPDNIKFYNWVWNPDSGWLHMDDSGRGGMTGNINYFRLQTTAMVIYIKNDDPILDLIDQDLLRYVVIDAVFTGVVRIGSGSGPGDVEGLFEVSGLHGQAPGFLTYSLQFTPKPYDLSQLSTLTGDALYSIILRVPPPQLNAVCRLNKNTSNVCRNQHFRDTYIKFHTTRTVELYEDTDTLKKETIIQPFGRVVVNEFYENGNLATHQEFVYGEKHGHWESRYENDLAKQLNTYNNNVAIGREMIWYNTDDPARITVVDGLKYGPIEKDNMYDDDGNYDGPQQWWYENGNRSYIGRYKHGQLNGAQQEWYENGQLRFVENFIDGKKDGPQERWLEDGTIDAKENYKNGLLNGKQEGWYEDGSPEYVLNYVDGVQEGEQREWQENGALTVSNMKNGELNGVQREWYANGRKKSVKNYVSGELHGVQKFYSEDGEKTETEYVNGEKVVRPRRLRF